MDLNVVYHVPQQGTQSLNEVLDFFEERKIIKRIPGANHFRCSIRKWKVVERFVTREEGVTLLPIYDPNEYLQHGK